MRIMDYVRHVTRQGNRIENALRDLTELEAKRDRHRREALDKLSRAADTQSARLEREHEEHLRQIEQALGKRLDRMERLQRGLHRRVAQAEQLFARHQGFGEAEFLAVAETAVEEGRTMLGYDRLFTLWQAARNVAALKDPGLAVAEVGTYRGGGALLIASALRQLSDREWDLHVLDTFEGHLPDTLTERDTGQRPGKFSDTSERDVTKWLRQRLDRVEIHPGDASQTVGHLPERRWGLVHLDVDLYQPTLDCLRYFGERMPAGAIVVLDDFGAESCPGIEEAYAAYAEERPSVFQVWSFGTEQLVLVRTTIA